MTTPSPAWTQVASMYHRRIHFYLVALPDGTVLAIGGSKGNDPCNVDNAVCEPEAYDPASNTWARYAANTTPRQYHSSVVLLPDGSLFVAGGQIGDEGSGGARYTSWEIFKPPYFFRATRPTITSAPAIINYNKGFDLVTPNALDVTKVRLIRTGAATHSFDQNQRLVELTFSVKQGTTDTLRITAPQHGDIAPPGYYLLYICTGTNGQNPSEGKFVRLMPGSIGPGGGP